MNDNTLPRKVYHGPVYAVWYNNAGIYVFVCIIHKNLWRCAINFSNLDFQRNGFLLVTYEFMNLMTTNQIFYVSIRSLNAFEKMHH